MFDGWRKMFGNLDLPRLEVRLDFSPDVRVSEGRSEPADLRAVRHAPLAGRGQRRESLLAMER